MIVLKINNGRNRKVWKTTLKNIVINPHIFLLKIPHLFYPWDYKKFLTLSGLKFLI